ncbi:MAG: exonuclease domain-containing protein [Lachnospiraceae bacterium]
MKKEQDTAMQLAQPTADYVLFDFETTGTSWQRDEIIEIAAVKVKNHKIVDEFTTLVNPKRPIPYCATQVNHITDEMVKTAPTLDKVLPKFVKFIGKNVLAGHNIKSFDLKFLNRATEDILGMTVTNSYIDTLTLARTCLPQLPHHRLTDLAEYFQIKTEGAHRALNDCVMNQKCLEELAKILQNQEQPICPKCGGLLVKRNGKFGEFYGCSNYPICRFTKNM